MTPRELFRNTSMRQLKVFAIIQQTVGIFGQIITAICLCWGLGLGLTHIWIWWHSLDRETCLISFQHATYLPRGRERHSICTDQYFRRAAVCILCTVPVIRAKSPWSTELHNHSTQRRLMPAECPRFSICLFSVKNGLIDMIPSWHMVTCTAH